MPVILSGLRHGAAGPALVLDDVERSTPTRSLLPVRDAPISLRWGAARFCTGHFDLDTYASAPCPERAAITTDETACARCLQRTGFNPSFYNLPRTALSPQQRAYNERPHVVYLAAFSRFCIKVGISSRDRFRHRWHGQGARVALVLAACDDAYEAREREAGVSRALSLREQVRGAKKRALLNEPLDLARTEEQLRRTRREAEAAVALPALDAALHHLDAVYVGGHPLAPPLIDLTDAASPAISGVGVGLVGDVLIVAQSECRYMIGLRTLIGRTVTVSRALHENQVPVGASQLGFGF